MQKYLLMSAMGMAILYGSIDIDSLLYTTYPPFGMVTISFMPIGSYLLFTGILRSATLAARDKELRKEFYNTAMSQFGLLKTIGVTEMEKELLKRYRSVDKRARSLDEYGPFEKDDMSEALHGSDDERDKKMVRQILHEVLAELYSKTGPKD